MPLAAARRETPGSHVIVIAHGELLIVPTRSTWPRHRPWQEDRQHVGTGTGNAPARSTRTDFPMKTDRTGPGFPGPVLLVSVIPSDQPLPADRTTM
ncbi:MAG: hypothetical protein AVDCRST_MAG33-349 [uncultured Thermomicrobiales bacterium]|uniref:Uncharacterized protein n=1 Tax=uncultured Thermomicrobiales bacterium TaxID=1645740 RepID=A0A6J4UA69_9BACT|nr:MAG: hypothetical protein AVDCRST_MAG33-349 [uncultured Thermomicrobiales bacterium]